jgi:hypothetical protein
MHPVFHISQLKKVVSARHTITPTLPLSIVLWSVLARILQRHRIAKGKNFVHQGLIQ